MKAVLFTIYFVCLMLAPFLLGYALTIFLAP
jgi:hypothetical protein